MSLTAIFDSMIARGMYESVMRPLIPVLRPLIPVALVRSAGLRNVTFYPSLNDDTGSNDEFYKAISNHIRAASKEIWIIGEGPQKPWHQAGGEVRYEKVWKNAFNDNEQLRVTRIQTTRDMKSSEWKEHLAFLLDNYSDRFNLYFAATNVAYSAVFDSHSPEHCVTETMLPAVYNDTEIAGFGIFIRRNSERLAQPMHRKMSDLVNGALPLKALATIMGLMLESGEVTQLVQDASGQLDSVEGLALRIGRTTTVRIHSSRELDAYLALFAKTCPTTLSQRVTICKDS
jgi:hypothetical protein